MSELAYAAPAVLGLIGWGLAWSVPRAAPALTLIAAAGIAASFLWYLIEPSRDGWPNFAIGLLFYPAVSIFCGAAAAWLRPGARWPALAALLLPYPVSEGLLRLVEPH